MNTEITDYREVRSAKLEVRRKAGEGAWVYYDEDCGMCTAWVHRFERQLSKRGFEIAPLQGPGVAEKLHLNPDELLVEMRVLRADGRVLGGADAIVELSLHFWWGWPVLWFSKLPGAMRLMRAGYRGVAERRTCKVPSSKLQAPEKHEAPNSKTIGQLGIDAHYRGIWWDWAPLLLLPVGALLTQNFLPAWLLMWVLALAIFFGCKWLTWRRAWRGGCRPKVLRAVGYLFAWPGMDAADFLAMQKVGDSESKLVARIKGGDWSFALAKTAVGAGLIWLAASGVPRLGPLATGWLVMIGIVLFLHFGAFDLLALGWRHAGVMAKPIMRTPFAATSLADFWSKRWNTAFHTLAHELAYRPLARRWGAARAILSVFLISGVVHEAVISLPARGGYGLPTAYFVLQGLGVLAERSALGRRLRLGRGVRGWLFVLLFTAGPAFWVFHPVFIKNVILPMLRAFGAN